MVSKLWDDVNEFSKSYSKAFYKEVSAYLLSLDNTIPRSKLVTLARNYFSKKLSMDFEIWRLNIESELIRNYTDVVNRSALIINNLTKKVTEIAANLFDISSPLLMDGLIFKSASGFTYKTKDDPLSIEIDIYKLLPYLLPRSKLSGLI